MKKRITPTQREIALEPGDFIVSKTDPKGRITYANRTFMQISDYSEPELLGQQHNLLRHPDMPRTIFKLLWERIQQGQECFAYIKNLSKNGDHYWVLANVTPDYDQGDNIIGFFSVRRRPEPKAIATITRLYAQMVHAEKAVDTRRQIPAGTEILDREIRKQGHHSYETFVLDI